MLRRSFATILAATVMMAIAQPAEAKAPATVTKVQIVAASTTSLTLDWSAVSGAKRYDVFFSTSYAKVKSGGTKRKTGSSSKYTVKGLKAGVKYCFMVRAVRGGSIGKRSQRTCKPTVRTGATTTGVKLRIVTFNTCSRVCGRSAKRTRQGQSMLTKAYPDIIALQEANYFGAPSGYASASESHAKKLQYRKSTFGLARHGEVNMGHDNWAVWAELIHLDTGRHLIAVSAHMQSGKSKGAASMRKSETKTLITRVKAQSGGLPIVFAGDFNSNKGRDSLDTVAPVMRASGYWDAYDLARTLASPNWNSSLLNGKPKFGVKWGDHVDHAWVTPTVRVRRWDKLGTLSKPYASDHFPVSVDLTVK